MANFFTAELSKNYDEKNRRLAPIADNMHFLIRLILKDLPSCSRLLCVGVGTGAEILSLCTEHPEWSFVGVDPSASMLEVCRERLKKAGVMDRCELIQGYVHEAPAGENFEAALSILVAHFVKREDRILFYQNMQQRLKAGGYLINTEISFDLDSPEFPSMLKNWEQVQSLMGATADSIQALPHTLRDILCVLPPAETERLIRAGGIHLPIRFFQSFLISGWYGRKE